MSDSNKHDEYNRIVGVREPMAHEKILEHNTLIYKDKLNRSFGSTKPFVKREGDIPPEGFRTVRVTKPQYSAYSIIVGVLKNPKITSIHMETLRKVGLREATIKALAKVNLIDITDNKVTLYKYNGTDQEIMEKGGVGNIVISIGVG
jgi:hypothetical protein